MFSYTTGRPWKGKKSDLVLKNYSVTYVCAYNLKPPVQENSKFAKIK
jgi:hypothetical protein